jgi:hypothetical protein
MNTIADWMKNSGFQIFIEKTVVVLICRKRIRNHEDPRITIGKMVLDVRKDHKILGLTLNNRLSWKKHIDETRAKAMKRLNISKSLTRTKWEADQGTLLRVHERMILSALEYRSVAYGSARHSVMTYCIESFFSVEQRIFCVNLVLKT